MEICLLCLRWCVVLLIAFFCGKLMPKIKMPAILGWLIAGMLLGPYGFGLLPQVVLDNAVYKIIITWMQCAFGLMLGTELVWSRIREYGRALIITTSTQSLGTFLVVSCAFAIPMKTAGFPIWLALAFGSIALATAPAPALSIVREFHTDGPVTETLLPMAVLDDVVGIVVFFSVDSFIASKVSGGAVPLYMIPVMILLPIAIGVLTGIPAGYVLKKKPGRGKTITILVIGITATAAIGRDWQANVSGEEPVERSGNNWINDFAGWSQVKPPWLYQLVWANSVRVTRIILGGGEILPSGKLLYKMKNITIKRKIFQYNVKHHTRQTK
jgi:NhaP-type Na+/H+ or K+/H+ antiporter